MKSFISIACLAACLCVVAVNGQYQQRKMAPQPTYGGSSSSNSAPSSSYGSESSGYESAAPVAAPAYRPQSSAMTSQYDERQSASSYGRPTASSYGSSKSSNGGYGGAQTSTAPAYAQAKPKYEEPYHPPMPFAWGYDINDGYGGAQYHKENGDEYGKRTGSYGYTDAYGIYRQVDYVADEYGFRATVKTNEPGTANEAPADVEWHAYEPPSKFYSGNTDSSYSSGSSSSSYGGQQQQQYQPLAASASSSSYGGQQQKRSGGYGGQQQQQQRASYSGNSGYPQQQRQLASSASYADQQQQQQQQQAYAASSVHVPVYERANAKLVPRKY